MLKGAFLSLIRPGSDFNCFCFVPVEVDFFQLYNSEELQINYTVLHVAVYVLCCIQILVIDIHFLHHPVTHSHTHTHAHTHAHTHTHARMHAHTHTHTQSLTFTLIICSSFTFEGHQLPTNDQVLANYCRNSNVLSLKTGSPQNQHCYKSYMRFQT